MKAAANYRGAFLLSSVMLILPAALQTRQQSSTPSSSQSRAESEAFLSKGRIVTDPPADGRQTWRASLDNGVRKHDASVETADGSDLTRRNYRLNVAAYELDKLLQLDLVPPSVVRFVNGRPASLTWWVDDFAMNELDRRRKAIDPQTWNTGPGRWTPCVSLTSGSRIPTETPAPDFT